MLKLIQNIFKKKERKPLVLWSPGKIYQTSHGRKVKLIGRDYYSEDFLTFGLMESSIDEYWKPYFFKKDGSFIGGEEVLGDVILGTEDVFDINKVRVTMRDLHFG